MIHSLWNVEHSPIRCHPVLQQYLLDPIKVLGNRRQDCTHQGNEESSSVDPSNIQVAVQYLDDIIQKADVHGDKMEVIKWFKFHLLQRITDGNRTNACLFIMGKGGTGKTFLSKILFKLSTILSPNEKRNAEMKD